LALEAIEAVLALSIVLKAQILISQQQLAKPLRLMMNLKRALTSKWLSSKPYKLKMGIQNQADVYNRLTQVAEGNGPNPALAQLNNATGQNVSNQAALMAGQRGAATNVGLIARQNALQGAQIQQQAAGQGAALQANQQMNAIGQMGGLASQQVGQQAGAVNSYNQFAQGEQANILNSIAAQNNAAVGCSPISITLTQVLLRLLLKARQVLRQAPSVLLELECKLLPQVVELPQPLTAV
jgi:hypothetical protein